MPFTTANVASQPPPAGDIEGGQPGDESHVGRDTWMTDERDLFGGVNVKSRRELEKEAKEKEAAAREEEKQTRLKVRKVFKS